jgi:hypothetical protein
MTMSTRRLCARPSGVELTVDGMELCKPSGGQARRYNVIAKDKDFGEIGGTSSGELPVGGEMGIVDGNDVGVACERTIIPASTCHRLSAIRSQSLLFGRVESGR